jgi:hypothetical protein
MKSVAIELLLSTLLSVMELLIWLTIWLEKRDRSGTGAV